MSDTKGEGCGLFPILFRGWAKKACFWHDSAYSEGSTQQQAGITRERVDEAFEAQLNELSKQGRFRAGKRLQAAIMAWVVRLPIVGRLYEGKKRI